MKFKFLPLVCIVLSATANAELACDENLAEIRLDQPGGVFEKIKTQADSHLEICHANTAALLYEVELGYPISYLDLALLAKRTDPEKTFESKDRSQTVLDFGNVEYAVFDARKNGICKREDSWMENHAKRDAIQKPLIQGLSSYLYDKSATSWNIFLKRLLILNKSVATEVKKVESTSMRKNSDVMQALIAPNCSETKNRVDVSMYKSVSHSPGLSKTEEEKKTWLRSFVREYLLKQKPIAASFCAGILYNENFRKTGDICGPHAMAIIGQRFNSEKGKCEVLFFNSLAQPGLNAWVSEESLVNNFLFFDTLEKQ